jgi:DNA adenine methylase
VSTLRSPIQWFGGKGMMLGNLLPLIPPHDTYVEVFGGGASLLFAKSPSSAEAYNDLNSGLVNLFRVLRDPEKFQRFQHIASLTLYSREEYHECRNTWATCEDEVEKARRFFVVARQSFGGRFGAGWGFAVEKDASRSIAGPWASTVDGLKIIHQRLRMVQVEHSDFRTLLARYDRPETFFYVDPPYVADTRKAGGYAHEMSLDDHADLVRLLLGLQGKAMLSGYAHPLYDPLEAAGWVRKDFAVSCRAAGRTKGTGIQGEGAATRMQPRTESVWLSPGCEQQQSLFGEGLE